ncbi:MAG: HPr family phosphocarrier protein [Chlamydiia bacterium]|nr:HPr family phosphocarrier protein [Chlamydiia bacterium]MCB1115246.1 HPr family phosphocarrier protein [Chlamydiia bacterium]
MATKVESRVKVSNRLGLHVRPATTIAKILQEKKSKVSLTYKGETVNARSIMSIMILAAPKSAQIQIIAEGEDAEETMAELVHAFDSKFGEES